MPLIERAVAPRGRRAHGCRRPGARAARRSAGRARRRSSWSRSAPRASSSTSCTATSTRRTRRAPPRSCARVWPNRYVTAGHTIVAEYREYERGTTAAVNAAIQPVLHRYIERLQSELARARLRARAAGDAGQRRHGVVDDRRRARGRDRDVGPGLGRDRRGGDGDAGRRVRPGEFANVVTYDMGGTSSDVALVLGGMPSVSSDLELEYAMPIHVPMVDVHTIGAGGGSIASVDAAGMLQGRPGERRRDAGADLLRPRRHAADDHRRQPRARPARPGSAARGRARGVDGGDPRRACVEHVGAPLGLDATAAAAAIVRVANDQMAGAIRMVSLARGHDPRDFALFAFGGAGPLHAAALARELAIPKVLIPARPGLTNALGCVVADLRHDFVATINQPLEALAEGRIGEVFAAQIGERPGADRARERRRRAHRHAAPRRHAVPGPEPHPAGGDRVAGDHDRRSCARLRGRVLAALRRRAARDTAGAGQPAHRGDRQAQAGVAAGDRARPARRRRSRRRSRTTRPVWFDGGWVETPVYVREQLPAEARIRRARRSSSSSTARP